MNGAQATETVLAFTDTVIRTSLSDHILDTLKKKYTPLLGPDTTITQRADNGGTGTSTNTSTKNGHLKALKAFLPLRASGPTQRQK